MVFFKKRSEKQLIFFKKRSEKQLKEELAILKTKEKARLEKKKLKSDIRKLRYGKYVKGAKTVGKGAATVAKGLGQAIDILAPPKKARKKRKRRRDNNDNFLDFDFGF